MRLPGFTAERSMQRARAMFRGVARPAPSGAAVLPATHVDEGCLAACKKDCGSVCAGAAGSARSACVKECSRENAACTAICTVADGGTSTGSGSSGGGGAGSDPCDAGKALACSIPISHCAGICAVDALLGTDWCTCMSNCLGHFAPPPLSAAGCFACVQEALRC